MIIYLSMIIIIMDYGVNSNGMDGEFKGNVLILETGKLIFQTGKIYKSYTTSIVK